MTSKRAPELTREAVLQVCEGRNPTHGSSPVATGAGGLVGPSESRGASDCLRSAARATVIRLRSALLVIGTLVGGPPATHGQTSEDFEAVVAEEVASAQAGFEGASEGGLGLQGDPGPLGSVEVERRLNEIRSEVYDRQGQLIGHILTMIAILLGVVGVLIPIAGLAVYSRLKSATEEGLSQVKEVARKASASSRSAATDAQAPRRMLQQIAANLEESKQHLSAQKRMTSDEGRYSPNSPGEKPESSNPTKEETTVRTAPEMLDEALNLEREDRANDAALKWRALAEAAESGNNAALAAHAWSSSGFLLAPSDPEEAIKDYDKAIQLDPSRATRYYNRGTAKAKLGLSAEAAEDFSKSIELNSKSPRAFYNRGNSMVALKRYEEAIADYGRVIDLDPSQAMAWGNRGSAKSEIGQIEEALDDFSKFIELRPDDAFGYFNRGSAKSRLGRYFDAIDDYSEAIKRDPNHAPAYFCRGNCKADVEQHEAAIRDFNNVIRLNPGHAKSYFNRSVSKRKLGRIVEAGEDYAMFQALRRNGGGWESA